MPAAEDQSQAGNHNYKDRSDKHGAGEELPDGSKGAADNEGRSGATDDHQGRGTDAEGGLVAGWAGGTGHQLSFAASITRQHAIWASLASRKRLAWASSEPTLRLVTR